MRKLFSKKRTFCSIVLFVILFSTYWSFCIEDNLAGNPDQKVPPDKDHRFLPDDQVDRNSCHLWDHMVHHRIDMLRSSLHPIFHPRRCFHISDPSIHVYIDIFLKTFHH